MSFALPPCDGIRTSSRDGAFEICDIPNILFGVRATSSRELVFINLTFMEAGAFIEVLLMLRAFPGVLH